MQCEASLRPNQAINSRFELFPRFDHALTLSRPQKWLFYCICDRGGASRDSDLSCSFKPAQQSKCRPVEGLDLEGTIKVETKRRPKQRSPRIAAKPAKPKGEAQKQIDPERLFKATQYLKEHPER